MSSVLDGDYCFVAQDATNRSVEIDLRPHDAIAKDHYLKVWQKLASAIDKHHEIMSVLPRPGWTAWRPGEWCDQKQGYEGREKYVAWYRKQSCRLLKRLGVNSISAGSSEEGPICRTLGRVPGKHHYRALEPPIPTRGRRITGLFDPAEQKGWFRRAGWATRCLCGRARVLSQGERNEEGRVISSGAIRHCRADKARRR